MTISGYEQEFGTTIQRRKSVVELAEAGREFVRDKPQELVDLAMGRVPYLAKYIATDGAWQLPAGAFKRGGGPT
jgi:hypothetical protein